MSKVTHEPCSEYGDAVGVCASLICLVHCCGVFLLAPLLPLVGPAALHDRFHLVIAPLVLGVAGYCFVTGYKRHHHLLPLAVSAFAGTLILSDLILELSAPQVLFLLRVQEHDLTIAGSVLLILSHLANVLLVRQHNLSYCFNCDLPSRG